MKKTLMTLALLAAGGIAAPAMAADCAVTVEGNDQMQFNVKNIEVPKSCKSYTVTLKHVGKMPKSSMGHNMVLTTTADATAELAAIAGLLRRAARQAQPGSESLRDDAWWQRVDPKGTLPGARRSLLAEGAYRPRVDASEVAAVRSWARERYLAMLLERRR